MSAVCVGNDVVDLENPRTEGRSADERFLGRVLSPSEQAVVNSSSDPDLELWCHWAAKEAGFKAISKVMGAPPPFVHRRFEVTWGATSEAQSQGEVVRSGRVLYDGRQAEVVVKRLAGALHAVGHVLSHASAERPRVIGRVAPLESPGSAWDGALEELRTRFSPREVDAVYSLASAAVRLGARDELARHLGVSEVRLEIVCAPGPTSRRPPRVLLDGGPVESDVSLSHDGRLIAWAFWVGATDGAGG